MNHLLKQVRQAQRRLTLQHFATVLPWCWFVALLVAGTAIAVGKFFPVVADERIWIAAWAGGALLAGLAFAIGWTLWRRNDVLQSAIELDHRFALKERVSTALALSPQELETPVGQAVVNDAIRRLDRLDVSDRFRVALNRKALLPVVPAVLAFVVAMFVDSRGQTNPVQATTDTEAQQIKRATKPLEKKAMARREEAKAKGLKDAEVLFKKLEQGTKDLSRNDVDRKKALVKLNDLKKQIEERREKLSGNEKLRQQLNQLKDFKQGPADKLGKALQNGDLRQAQKEIDRLRKQMQKGELDPKEQQKLAEQLKDMSRTLEKLAKDHQQAKSDLKKEIERQERAGQKTAADKLRQQLDQLEKQGEQTSKMSKMAQQLAKAAGQLQKGNANDAEQELAQLSDELEGMQKSLDEMEMLSDAMAQMDEAKSSMNCQQCKGKGCRGCQGQGNKQGKPGDGLGKARGFGDRPETKNKTQSYDSNVKQKVGPGTAVISGTGDGPNRRGEVQEQIKEEFASAKREAADPLVGQNLPRHQREHAKKYFNSLREGRQ